jgi:branched-chain amino acid transport system substrate-binding protein
MVAAAGRSIVTHGRIRFGTARAAALTVCAAVAVVAVGCGNGKGPVVIGAVYDLTGSQAPLDVPSATGARLAAEQVNRNGGVLGRHVDLVVVDGASEPDVAHTRTAELLKSHPTTAGVVGLSDTNMVLAAAPVAAAAERVFLTSGATSPELPARVPQWLFLACFGDNVQAAAAAEWIFGTRGARTASIAYSTTNDYTRLLQRYFTTRFQQLGGRIVSTVGYDPATVSAATLAALAPADVIFLSAQPDDAIAVTSLLRGSGVTTPILGGDAFDSNAWAAHPSLGDVYFTTHAYLGADSTDGRVLAFRALYRGAHPNSEPDAFTALGYDATQLLLDAIERAGSDDPQDVRAALAATRDFAGVTGTISYGPGDRIPMKPVTILAIEGGAERFEAAFVPQVVPAP